MVSKTLFSSNSGEWSTPQKLFDSLNRCYSFTVDAAASKENAKLERYWNKETNGLAQDWSGERIFCNPPYGRDIGAWLKKAWDQSPGISVFLLPARTDTKWYHLYIIGNDNAHVHFLPGRLKFGGAKNSAPFPSMLVTFLNW